MLFLLLLLCLANIKAVDVGSDDMIDNSEEYIDPNDMLTFSSLRNEIITDDLNDRKLYLEDGCNVHKGRIKSLTKEVSDCSSKLNSTKANLKQSVDTIRTLQDNHIRNATPAVALFYLRILKSFWNLLEMEKQEASLTDEESRIEVLQVSFSLQDIKNFQNMFNNTLKHAEIDEFFYSNFEKITTRDATFGEYLQKEWLQPLGNLELWLYGLGLLVLILSFWAFSLCVIDVQRNTRWTRVVGMIFFLLFVISCVEHWRIMVKIAEAKKRSEAIQIAPEHCGQPPSYWEMIGMYFTGTESKCEKYHRQILIQASEEVTPLMAISETITLFFLQPLKHLGTHVGLFFTEFYANIPLLWAIPATFVFCFLVTLILFGFFGYGIEFPFWLGGIRPVSSSRTDERKLCQLLDENRKQLRDERNNLLTEAKDMLRDISVAAISHTQRMQNEAVMLQPFFASSACIIERQLEQIVSKRFNSQMVRSAVQADAVDCGVARAPIALPYASSDERREDDFVTQIKNMLEDSFPSDESFSSPRRPSDYSDIESKNGFLAEVRKVMTP